MMKFEEIRNGMIFRNVKNEKVFKIIGIDDKARTVKLEDGEGKTKDASYSTIKRWYEYMNIIEQEEQEPEAPAKERKVRQKKEMAEDIKALHEYVLNTCEQLGGVVFVPAKEMKFRGLKAGKHMFVKYHWTNNSVILQVRAEALGLDAPKNPVNHTFNDKYIFREDTEETRAEVFRIMKMAYDWQVCRNLAREEKKTKKQKEDKTE